MGAVIDTLQCFGKLDNTVIVYTSDNGYLWGEHGLQGKTLPYEESMRVPLVLVVPGIVPRHNKGLVVSNRAIPTTLWHLAGLPTVTAGRNLLPRLQDPQLPWRPQGILREFFQPELLSNPPERTIPSWAGWRTTRYKDVGCCAGCSPGNQETPCTRERQGGCGGRLSHIPTVVLHRPAAHSVRRAVAKCMPVS